MEYHNQARKRQPVPRSVLFWLLAFLAISIFTAEASESKKQLGTKINGKYLVEIGEGGCRGHEWQDEEDGWPKFLGRKSLEKCAKSCEENEDCSAIHVLRPEGTTYECLHFDLDHEDIIVVKGLGGFCYKLTDKLETDKTLDGTPVKNVGPIKPVYLGRGRCRGTNWMSAVWPIERPRCSIPECAKHCAKTRGCSAFDVSDEKKNLFDCLLYGHREVKPASNVPGECFTLADRFEWASGKKKVEDEDDDDDDVTHAKEKETQKGNQKAKKTDAVKKEALKNQKNKPEGTKKSDNPRDKTKEDKGKEKIVEKAKPKQEPKKPEKKPENTKEKAPTPQKKDQEKSNKAVKNNDIRPKPSKVPVKKNDKKEELKAEPNIVSHEPTVKKTAKEQDENKKARKGGYIQVGRGVCRGPEWQGKDNEWPKVLGEKTLGECAEECRLDEYCTAFDMTPIGKEKEKKRDCHLFGHRHIRPADNLKGNCYRMKDYKKVFAEHVRHDLQDNLVEITGIDQDAIHLGEGACRGPKWQAKKNWPKVVGKKFLEDCGRACAETKGCTAFHRYDENKLKPRDLKECILFGHKQVSVADNVPGDCYTLTVKVIPAGAKPKKKRKGRVQKDIPKFQLNTGYINMGKGLCRGPKWTYGLWPKPVGESDLPSCFRSCYTDPKCTGFDLSPMTYEFGPSTKKLRCVLFGHKRFKPANNLKGQCYRMKDYKDIVPDLDEESQKFADEHFVDLVGNQDAVLLGKGACRGHGWQMKGWPKIAKSPQTVPGCGQICSNTKGCKAFTAISEEKSQCLMFGHKKVAPAANVKGECYALTAKPVGPKLAKTVTKSKATKAVEKTAKSSTEEKTTKKTLDKKTASKKDVKKKTVVVDDDDEEWLSDLPPGERRSRDHIDEILDLNEKEATIKQREAETEAILKSLKKVSEASIAPLEMTYKYRELSNRHFGDPEIFNKPLIVLMGPWSAGKSTMINYLLGTESTEKAFKATAEPSQGFNFNIAMHGDQYEELEGTELAAEWSLSSLQKFGQEFLKKLKGKKMPNKLLQKATFAEIPGVLETGSNKRDRKYSFNDAAQWFIDHADLILLIYDYAKLDIGPETEALLDQLKGRESQVRLILNKADEITAEELLKIQSSLVWNVSPLMASMEPPTMYAGSFWSRPYKSGAPKKLLKAQEISLLNDIKSAIDKRVENRISTARRFAVRVRNHAKMVDCYLTTYYNHKSFFGDKTKTAQMITDHPEKYHIYEGISTMTNISRYDLPDPQTYRTFFNLHPLPDFPLLQSTCTFFRGCPINKLDLAIAYDLPELLSKFKHGKKK